MEKLLSTRIFLLRGYILNAKWCEMWAAKNATLLKCHTAVTLLVTFVLY